MNDIEPGKDGRLDDVVQSYLELRILEMMEYGHGALRQFPTSEKYTLAADINPVKDNTDAIKNNLFIRCYTIFILFFFYIILHRRVGQPLPLPRSPPKAE